MGFIIWKKYLFLIFMRCYEVRPIMTFPSSLAPCDDSVENTKKPPHLPANKVLCHFQRMFEWCNWLQCARASFSGECCAATSRAKQPRCCIATPGARHLGAAHPFFQGCETQGRPADRPQRLCGRTISPPSFDLPCPKVNGMNLERMQGGIAWCVIEELQEILQNPNFAEK